MGTTVRNRFEAFSPRESATLAAGLSHLVVGLLATYEDDPDNHGNLTRTILEATELVSEISGGTSAGIVDPDLVERLRAHVDLLRRP